MLRPVVAELRHTRAINWGAFQAGIDRSRRSNSELNSKPPGPKYLVPGTRALYLERRLLGIASDFSIVRTGNV